MEAVQLVKYRGARKVFETLLKFPKRKFTISELAKTSKIPFASAWRLVKKWEPAGIIECGRVGNSVTVALRESEYARRVADLMELSVSPQAFTAEALKKTLKKMRGFKEAYLFGSVARGEEKLSSDIDIALLVGKEFDSSKLMLDVYEQHGTKVIPLTFSDKKKLLQFLSDKEKVRLA